MQSDLYILRRECDFLEDSVTLFHELVESLKDGKEAVNESAADDPSYMEDLNEQEFDREFTALQSRLDIAKSTIGDCVQRRKLLSLELDNRRTLEDNILKRVSQLSYTYSNLEEFSASISAETADIENKLQKLSQYDSVNDTFHIWYSGPFATINNLRLGTLPSCVIEWSEINAALGQAVLAIAVTAEKAKIEFKTYGLMPMGSFPKIYKIDDRRTIYSLFTDGSFSLFPRKKFNLALVGFLHCVAELGEHVSIQDPTLSLPYVIKPSEGLIHNQSVLLGADNEIWTRSLKFLLADIKWIIAWAAKYCQ